MKPTRKWVVIAVCEDAAELQQMILNMRQDLRDEMQKYESKMGRAFPYEVELIPKHIPVNSLQRRDLDGDKYCETCIGTYIRKATSLAKDQLHGLTLILNRDLLARHGIGDKFADIVKNNFFKRVPNPRNIICCFGGVPDENMRHHIPSNATCPAFKGCSLCTSQPEKCNHTCYWHLIGLVLLPAWPGMRSESTENKDKFPYPPIPFIYP